MNYLDEDDMDFDILNKDKFNEIKLGIKFSLR